MQFRLISNHKTVVCQNDGTVRKVHHNPPLGWREVLDFVRMLIAPDRNAPSQRTRTDNQPDAPVTAMPTGQPREEELLPKSPDEIVGYFQCGGTNHPLTVLSGAGILKALCGRAQHLGQFAIELYQEAARVLGYGDTMSVVLPEPVLRHKFARTIRAILPEFRRVFQERHRGMEIEGSYSRMLFSSDAAKGNGSNEDVVVFMPRGAGKKSHVEAVAGESGVTLVPFTELLGEQSSGSESGSTGKPEEGTSCPGGASGSENGAVDSTVDQPGTEPQAGDTTSGADGTGSQSGKEPQAGGTTSGADGTGSQSGDEVSESERRKASYNRVMGTTVRAVLELTLPSVSDFSRPDVSGINFASVAKEASDIRRKRIGHKRGNDILPRTATRILGRCVSLKLGHHELGHMSDEQLVSMFIPLAERDERVLSATGTRL
jgi:hypothetical protein